MQGKSSGLPQGETGSRDIQMIIPLHQLRIPHIQDLERYLSPSTTNTQNPLITIILMQRRLAALFSISCRLRSLSLSLVFLLCSRCWCWCCGWCCCGWCRHQVVNTNAPVPSFGGAVPFGPEQVLPHFPECLKRAFLIAPRLVSRCRARRTPRVVLCGLLLR